MSGRTPRVGVEQRETAALFHDVHDQIDFAGDAPVAVDKIADCAANALCDSADTVDNPVRIVDGGNYRKSMAINHPARDSDLPVIDADDPIPVLCLASKMWLDNGETVEQGQVCILPRGVALRAAAAGTVEIMR